MVGAPVTVSLAYEAGPHGLRRPRRHLSALAPLAAEHQRAAARGRLLRAALAPAALAPRALAVRARARALAPGSAVRLLEGGGERAELELVASEVARAADAGGWPRGDRGRVRGPAAVRASCSRRSFAAAGVPHTMPAKPPLADSAIGRALIGLLRCVPEAREAPGAGPRRARARICWPGCALRGCCACRSWPTRSSANCARGSVTAARARTLWEQRNWQLETIDELLAAQAQSPVALIDRAARELTRLLGAPMRTPRPCWPASARTRPAPTRRRPGRCESSRAGRARGRSGSVARVGVGGRLEAVEFLAGEPAGGDPGGGGAVAVLDPLALRARRVRALFICGLQEGAFPSPRRRRGLLSEEDRHELERLSGLRLGRHEDQLAAERYLLYAAVSRPEELLVLSWHVADDDGMATPARCSWRTSATCSRRTCSKGPPAPGPGAGRASRQPAAAAGEESLHDERVLAELARARGLPLAGELPRLPGALVRRALPASRRRDPDAEPLRRGGLAHSALKDTLEGLRERTGSAPPDAGQPAAGARAAGTGAGQARVRAAAVGLPRAPPGHAAAAAGGHRALPRVRRPLRSRLEPGPLELAFGLPPGGEESEPEHPAFELGDGVVLRGRIDRVDLSPSGDAVVVDYKNRSCPRRHAGSATARCRSRCTCSAVEALLARSVVGGFYQPLSGPDLRPRGVLEEEAGIGLDGVRGDERPREDLRELLGEALSLAREGAARARRGESRVPA